MNISCPGCQQSYDSKFIFCPHCGPTDTEGEEAPPLSPMGSAEFPAIEVEEFATCNSPGADRLAIAFKSGPMSSALIFSPALARELVIGLQKSLARLDERKKELET